MKRSAKNANDLGALVTRAPERFPLTIMKTRHFRDLQVWQRSMSLTRDVYRITARFPKSEIFGLSTQMRRSAVSVPSNIAEGHGRFTDKSFGAFLSQARGSLNELETQAELALQLHFADADQGQQLLEEIKEVARMLNALIATVRRSARSHPAP